MAKAISPRTGCGSCAATLAGVPQSCCSWSFVYSRTRNRFASGVDCREIDEAAHDAMRRFVPNRRGFDAQCESRKTSRGARWTCAAENLRKRNRRSGKPESNATPNAALGPGNTSTAMPLRRACGDEVAAADRRCPACPASLVTATSSSRARSRIAAVTRRAFARDSSRFRAAEYASRPRVCARRACLRQR